MILHPKARTTLLAAALAASGMSAWAAYSSSYIPSYGPGVTVREASVLATEPARVADEHALLPNERIVTIEEAPLATTAPLAVPAPVAVPAATRAEPPITITQPRLTDDQRIQGDVMELLARNPNLSGRIGVVTVDRVVTLTGYTLTSGQAWRAGRDARAVEGVRHVVNEIRPRVGGITS